MPEGRYPGAEWMPGANAGYARGRTPVSAVVCHYTVGRNSTAIMLKGYYQFQVNRDGSVYQGAEADAVCWHAGSPWNQRGPGIEVEYHPNYDDVLWTPAQEQATARLVEWLHDEWGVPFAFYDGPRIANHAGFITHRSLIQTGDAHSDWWPYLPRTSAPEPPEEDEDVKLRPFIISVPSGPNEGQWIYDPRTHTARPFGTEQARDTWAAIYVIEFQEPPVSRADPVAVALLEDAVR